MVELEDKIKACRDLTQGLELWRDLIVDLELSKDAAPSQVRGLVAALKVNSIVLEEIRGELHEAKARLAVLEPERKIVGPLEASWIRETLLLVRGLAGKPRAKVGRK